LAVSAIDFFGSQLNFYNHLSNTIMKTHLVIDLVYHEEEGNQVFAGTEQECNDWVEQQFDAFTYKVVPMTKEELKIHNS